MRSIPKDFWIGSVLLAVAVLYWYESSKIRVSPLDGPVGAAGLPKALAWALGILALILMLRSIAGALLARKAPKDSGDGDESEFGPHLRAVGMLALGVGYLLILPYLGYIASICLLLAAVALYNGGTANLRTAAFAAIGAVVFYFLFVRFLGIPLPAGIVEGLFTGI